ncbi:MAG: hypothetical protein HRU07_03920 [Nitrosopumilus sp.]|nr:hypothetical protein [Nitrosopumilus sp.]NRA05303.1 hypothetical protein [Nitrosopumilus sp.]
MAKKQTDVKIKIAIITGIFIVIAYVASAYVGSPVMDTQWKERPIADFSFGNMDGFPYEKLPVKNGQYYVDIVMINRGGSDAKLTLIIQGTNTKVRLGDVGDFNYQHMLPFTKKVSSTVTYPIYLIPDENTNQFTIQLSYEESDKIPMFQEINLFSPLLLTYEKTENGYVLIDQQ